MEFEPNTTQYGGPPTPPDFEQLKIDATNAPTAYYTILGNPDMQGASAIAEQHHKLLWDPYFSIFYAKAKDYWDKMQYYYPAPDKDAETPTAKATNIYYKNSYEQYLRRFKEYLDASITEADPNQNPATLIKNQYLPDTNVNMVTEGGKTVPDTEDTLNQTRLNIWKSFLFNKTDLPVRAKTVYLWVILDLMETIGNIIDAAVNQAVGARLLAKAGKAAVDQMRPINFQQEEKFLGIVIPAVRPEIVSHNADAKFEISVLKNYQSSTQAKSEERSKQSESSMGNYTKQYAYITGLLNQLSDSLADIIK